MSQSLAFAPQILPAQVPQVAAHGFVTVINNRPDHEEPGQPLSAEIAAACAAAGLDYHHIPIRSGMVTPEAVSAFAEAVAASPGPVFVFCRSGARSRMLAEAAGLTG